MVIVYNNRNSCNEKINNKQTKVIIIRFIIIITLLLLYYIIFIHYYYYYIHSTKGNNHYIQFHLNTNCLVHKSVEICIYIYIKQAQWLPEFRFPYAA